MPFVKLDCGLLDSSLWAFSPERELFITALLMAVPFKLEKETPQLDLEGRKTGFKVPPGEYGLVQAAWVGIVDRARLKANGETMKAIKTLGAPDLWSKSSTYEGRRLVRIDGGFLVLNYGAYRERDYTAAARMRKMRVTRNNRNVTAKTVTVTQAEAEAEAEADNSTNSTKGTNTLKSTTEGLSLKKERPRLSDEAFVESFAQDNTYSGINVPREYGKMRRWCTVNKVQPTRRRFVNWLNRIEPPLRAKEHLVKIDPSTIDVPERFKAWVAERYPSKRAAAMNWQTWADVPSHGLREEWWKDEQGRLT
jgi:hypothetical protein